MQIEVVVRKDELQHVAHLCRLEIDSMGRITAGILRLLKLDGSVGQAALDQLSRLGNFSFFFHLYKTKLSDWMFAFELGNKTNI